MRSRKTWRRLSRLQARLSSSNALAFKHRTIPIAIFVAPNWIREKDMEQNFFFIILSFYYWFVSYLLNHQNVPFTIVIVNLLTSDIESLLHTHVMFFCTVCIFTSAYSRLYPPSDLYTVRWTSLSFVVIVSRMLVVHLHIQFDWLIYAFSRTPHENSKTY